MAEDDESNSLWKKLLNENILLRGWHLARLDTRNDFAEDLFSTDSFGIGLNNRIKEISNRIRTGTYQSKPLMLLEVPKGSVMSTL